ncbi:MAG: helix-turn-helix domain-containing protein [Lactimicrobium sp.]|jgi:hypothetical protein|uniref:helix-turn-helix domain-containing protein n=1 Tax=Lactimicrobium sp. TaxID=2563780 RepID=UPI002F359D51
MKNQHAGETSRQLKNIRKNLIELEEGNSFHMIMTADLDSLFPLTSTSLWIIHHIECNTSSLDHLLDCIRTISPGCAAVICGHDLLAYPITGQDEKEIDRKSQDLAAYLKAEQSRAVLLECPDLHGTKTPAYLYGISIGFIHDARIIYPHASYLSMQKIRFARMVRLTMENDNLLAVYTGVMQFLEKEDPHAEPCTLLCTYYLDCRCDVAGTAAMLYLHRNTVKYRIRKISALLGYDITDSNENINLIVACALNRLYRAEEKMSKKF